MSEHQNTPVTLEPRIEESRILEQLEHLGTVPVILGALGARTLQKNGLD